MISKVRAEVVVDTAMNRCGGSPLVDELEVRSVAMTYKVEPNLNLPGLAEYAQDNRSGRTEVANLDADVGQMFLDRVNEGNLGRRFHEVE